MPHADLSRRTFLVGASAITAAGTLLGCGGAGGLAPLVDPESPSTDGVTSFTADLEAARQSDPALWNLTRLDFDGWRGEEFEVAREDGDAVSLSLVRVEDRSHEMSDETREMGLREPFSVSFHTTLGGEDLPVGRHQLSHPAMGEVVVFIADGGTTDDAATPHLGPERRVYEVHFN